jgi:hypothetical protein
MSKSSEGSTKKIASFEPREPTMDTQLKVYLFEKYSCKENFDFI